MDYYKQKQFLAQVDKNDRILGKIEKWECHKKEVLHRGYTCMLIYKDAFILQHRKHPVFDGVFDLSFSSHQIYTPPLSSRASVASRGISLQDDLTAIYDGLKREWNLKKEELKEQPKLLKKICYKAKDPNSDYSEHEIDYIYKVKLKKLPSPNLDFSYGFSLVPKKNFLTSNYYLITTNILAPWVKVILKEKLV